MRSILGFTLIEVLFALGILSTVILGTAQVYLRTHEQLKQLGAERQLLSELSILVQYQRLNRKADYFAQDVWQRLNFLSDPREYRACTNNSNCRDETLRDQHLADLALVLQKLNKPHVAVESCGLHLRCVSVQWPSHTMMVPVGVSLQ